MAKNRYIGEYPVIGIRPTIDGRRGALKVRESLEDQTMNMAKAAAKLFEENLRWLRSSSPIPPSAAWPRAPRAKRNSATTASPSR